MPVSCRMAPGDPASTVMFGTAADTGKCRMTKLLGVGFMLALLTGILPAMAQDGLAKPNPILKQVVEGMPRGAEQEVRVMTASFKPGDKTVFHTHRSPVTVYVLEGAFTLEMEGHQTVTVKAGQAMMEPTHVKMTGYNRSATEPLRVVIFYVSEPDTP